MQALLSPWNPNPVIVSRGLGAGVQVTVQGRSAKLRDGGCDLEVPLANDG